MAELLDVELMRSTFEFLIENDPEEALDLAMGLVSDVNALMSMEEPKPTHEATQAPDMGSAHCPRSKRVDGDRHSFAFMGDDPYIKCHWCNEIRDALSGVVIVEGDE